MDLFNVGLALVCVSLAVICLGVLGSIIDPD